MKKNVDCFSSLIKDVLKVPFLEVYLNVLNVKNQDWTAILSDSVDRVVGLGVGEGGY